MNTEDLGLETKCRECKGTGKCLDSQTKEEIFCYECDGSGKEVTEKGAVFLNFFRDKITKRELAEA